MEKNTSQQNGGKMIKYSCRCGDVLNITDNTEQTRQDKRAWKDKHYNASERIQKRMSNEKRRKPKRDRVSQLIHGFSRQVIIKH